MAKTLREQLRETVSALVNEVVQERIGGHGLRLYGVEVTQATQYWDSASHRDNSIRLVAFKPVYVRVYVRFRGGSPLKGVTGTATIQWPHMQFGAYKEILPRRYPPSIEATAEPVNERDDPKASLNFLIPATKVRGPMRLQRRDPWRRGAELGARRGDRRHRF